MEQKFIENQDRKIDDSYAIQTLKAEFGVNTDKTDILIRQIDFNSIVFASTTTDSTSILDTLWQRYKTPWATINSLHLDNEQQNAAASLFNAAKVAYILLGKEEIDFSIINAINKSAGNVFMYRFWGTYDNLIDLTDFNIKKSYKDKYRTIPCTKLISALRNAKIFCPSTETNLRFYINSRRLNLKSFTIDLKYKDAYNNPIEYTVYYTEQGYNSNSTLFEVRQRSGA